MGRAGGGGGSRSHSSGGHSSSRSGGGHHVSSSHSGSRAGSGRSYSSSGSGRSYGSSYHTHYSSPRRYSYGGGRSYSRSSGGVGSVIGTLVFLAIIIIVIWVAARYLRGSLGSDSNQMVSTHDRTKLETGISYNADCVIDELGWFDSVSDTERKLEDFYDTTGVQPYIYLKSYDPTLTTDQEKDAWTIQYYDDHFENENVFLYIYFAEQDADNDVGYMTYANGQLVDSIMDTEAVEIFWNNIDRYWYSDYSTDEVFIRTYNDTAKTIMADANAKLNYKTTITKAVTTIVIIILVIGAVSIILILLIIFWAKKQKRAKEEAEETERILNTPMQDLVKDAMESDTLKDLKNKYDNM